MLKKYNSREELTDDEIDVVVRDYSSRVFSNKRDRHVQMQKILPGNLGKNSKILDYGCGVGVVSQFFREKYNCIVDGVEISEIELHKAKATFEEDNKLRFILSSEFKYPKNYYDLIFSSQVIEHVHNPGNYLSKINYMTKDGGYLLIGLPNIVNFDSVFSLIFYSQKRAIRRSKYILENYHKASDHINGWDPYHFITLLGTCGFELVQYLPTEGTPVFSVLSKIPFIGKHIARLPFTTRLSYTMFFLVKKVKNIKIGNDD